MSAPELLSYTKRTSADSPSCSKDMSATISATETTAAKSSATLSTISKGLTAHDLMLLPIDYVLNDNDVICGRGSRCFNHPGNKQFRFLVESQLERYAATVCKYEKTAIICEIINQVRAYSPCGGFVKKDQDTGRYFEVGDFFAREKTSQAFRDALQEGYKSSTASKKKKRFIENQLNLKRCLSEASKSFIDADKFIGNANNNKNTSFTDNSFINATFSKNSFRSSHIQSNRVKTQSLNDLRRHQYRPRIAYGINDKFSFSQRSQQANGSFNAMHFSNNEILQSEKLMDKNVNNKDEIVLTPDDNLTTLGFPSWGVNSCPDFRHDQDEPSLPVWGMNSCPTLGFENELFISELNNTKDLLSSSTNCHYDMLESYFDDANSKEENEKFEWANLSRTATQPSVKCEEDGSSRNHSLMLSWGAQSSPELYSRNAHLNEFHDVRHNEHMWASLGDRFHEVGDVRSMENFTLNTAISSVYGNATNKEFMQNSLSCEPMNVMMACGKKNDILTRMSAKNKNSHVQHSTVASEFIQTAFSGSSSPVAYACGKPNMLLERLNRNKNTVRRDGIPTRSNLNDNEIKKERCFKSPMSSSAARSCPNFCQPHQHSQRNETPLLSNDPLEGCFSNEDWDAINSPSVFDSPSKYDDDDTLLGRLFTDKPKHVDDENTATDDCTEDSTMADQLLDDDDIEEMYQHLILINDDGNTFSNEMYTPNIFS